ncbi:alpha/beta hydrolase family protein [Pseudomonas sp. UBA6323]|uniref:alpha/beta hydrolase family protein n=1 Tax=Pseudomonas sp. UBA6323 TaxID=1947329 RepID=UPI0025DEEDC1|nr:alpha/beta hydrolase family protein [Pseudomonas sp. UBA6323]
MRPHSLALLGLCLFCAATSWAQESPEDAQNTAPGETDTPAANERPLLPERSVSDAQTLERRLDKREQQLLQAGAESFLALWLPANVGEPSGAVILVPDDVENADGAAAVGPLRRKLPDAGWHSLSLTLPDPDGDPLPLRSTTAAPAEIETPSTESAPATEPPPETPDDGAQQVDDSAISPEQRRQAHVERVMARLEAAIAFAEQQQAREIVLLGHGSGAYWAARYLSERKPANVHNLLMVAAELPAGFAPPLDELVAQLPVASGDFYYKDQATDRSAALKRLQASKRAKLPTYIQVSMKALPGNLDVQQEQLYRRLRGWLQLHIRASGG